MSTLEQLLEMGREEGLEKGVHKKSIFNLLKTAAHFPDWPAAKLSDFTALSMETITSFLSVKSQEDAEGLKNYILQDLLAGIPLSAEDKSKLDRLILQLADG